MAVYLAKITWGGDAAHGGQRGGSDNTPPSPAKMLSPSTHRFLEECGLFLMTLLI